MTLIDTDPRLARRQRLAVSPHATERVTKIGHRYYVRRDRLEAELARREVKAS